MKLKIILLISLFISSCGIRNFQPIISPTTTLAINPVYGTAELNYCLVEDEIVSEVKTIIVLDESGSNCANDATHGACNYGGANAGLQATDPQRIKRTAGLLEYLNNQDFKDSEFFSLLGFFCDNGTCSQSGDGDNRIPTAAGAGQSPNYTPQNEAHPFITNTNKEFSQTVQEFANRKDGQFGTNFRKALVEINATILKDAENAKARYEKELEEAEDPSQVEIKPAFYKVVFASDGSPTDTGANHYQEYLINYVKDQIVALRNHSTYGDFIHEVVLSGAFYHHDLAAFPVPQKLIKDMAEAGNGKYLEFDVDNTNIDFEALLNIPIKKINTSEEYLVVTNLNTIWAPDPENPTIAAILKDTDGDGIDDFSELPACIDKVDCDDNGVSDKVELLVYQNQCRVLPDRSGCDLSNPQISPDLCKTETGMVDADNDGLTECEENTLLSTRDKGLGAYDSNKDQVPDGLALRFDLDLTQAEGDDSNRSQRNIHSDEDGVSNFDELRKFTPIFNNNSTFSNLLPYKYTKTQVFDDPEQRVAGVKCFKLLVEDISLASPEDRIEVHLLQKSIAGNGKIIYKRFEKKLTDKKVIFSREDFE